MRVGQVNRAIAQAISTLRQLWRTEPDPKPEVISSIVGRMNYGQTPYHARRYVEGYAQALKDSKDGTISS
jgi:hypothetical protein